MENIIHRVGIKAPIQEVYKALSTIEGISGWWTTHATGISRVGETIVLKFYSPDGTEMGNMNIKVRALEPNKLIHWKFWPGRQNGLVLMLRLICAKTKITRLYYSDIETGKKKSNSRRTAA